MLALLPEYEKTSGRRGFVENQHTVGALMKRIEAGESFDVVVITPETVDKLVGEGRVISGSRTNLARVGVGVMVKTGANKPDISTVDAFKKAVLEAKSVSFIDPASGGSSGIYVEKLFERLGISDQVKPKEKLKQGGYVADYVKSGQAELGIHQISGILPHAGVTLVGPLPKEIQNYTVYAAGIGKATKDGDTAQGIDRLVGWPIGPGVVQIEGHGARGGLSWPLKLGRRLGSRASRKDEEGAAGEPDVLPEMDQLGPACGGIAGDRPVGMVDRRGTEIEEHQQQGEFAGAEAQDHRGSACDLDGRRQHRPDICRTGQARHEMVTSFRSGQ